MTINEQETTAIDKFFEDVEQTGDEFADIDTETPETVPAEETPEEPTDEEKQPFHKDPKVQKFIDRQIKKALSNTNQEKPVTTSADEPKDQEDLIAAFTLIIGNDTPEKVHALKMLEKSLSKIKDEASEKAISRIEQARAEEKRIESETNAYMSNSFEEIEETFSVDLTSKTPQAKKMNNEFREYLYKIAPKNQDGTIIAMPDIVSSFETFQMLNQKEKSTKAKELASRGMSRNTTTSSEQPKERITFETINRLFNL